MAQSLSQATQQKLKTVCSAIPSEEKNNFIRSNKVLVGGNVLVEPYNCFDEHSTMQQQSGHLEMQVFSNSSDLN